MQMSKVYTNQKTGLAVASGRVKAISEDAKSITIGVQQYVKDGEGNGHYESTDIVLVASVPVEGIAENDLVTATGFKAGAGRINIDTINHENAYVEAEGFGIISGEVLFANKNDEIDKETGEPRLTGAGTPKKPHFDITVAVGTGKERVNHTVKVYNVKDQDNIGRYEKLFANFDRNENPVYVSIVTRVENASPYMKETKDKQGRIWQNQYMSHMGINSLDANFVKGKVQQAAKNTAPITPAATPAQTAPITNASAEPAAQAPTSGSGFNYNMDDFNLNDLDDLDMAQ